MSPDKIPYPDKETIAGIRIARWVGRCLGITLILWAIYVVITDFFLASSPSVALLFKPLVFVGLGSLYLLPWQQSITAELWKKCFLLLILMTSVFVFTLMASVMTEHIAITQTGKKPPPPMFEGMIVFLVLIQVPTILFERNPHWLD